MYNINRQESADILGISTRSIDRYIKSGKIRAKKNGKIVLLNSVDVNNLNSKSLGKVILSDNDLIKSSGKDMSNKDLDIVKKDEYNKILVTFEKMYSGFREEIKQKDEKIENLSIRLGKAEEQKDNKIDLIEYKKVQFLSEQSKNELSIKLEKEMFRKQETINELKYEKNTNKLLIVFIIILFIISGAIFFINI